MRQLLRREEERKRVANQMPVENPRPAPTASAKRNPPAANPPEANRQSTPAQNPPPASAPGAAAAPPRPQPPPTVASQVVNPSSAAPDGPPVGKERAAQVTPPSSAPATPKPDGSAPQQTPPPAARPQLTPTSPPVQLANQPLSGKWIYSAGSASNSPFPPETVTLNLTEVNGQVRGIFAGRYRVPRNNKFSGRVTFSFDGPVHPGSSKFPFTASDGMKGTIEVIRLPGRQDTIEVVWHSERDKLTFDDLYFRLP
jgi:hypothetical protein